MEDPIQEKIKSALAPSTETRTKIKQALNDYSIYIIIVLVTSIVVFIPPLVGGCLQGDVAVFFPSTPSGWILWAMTNAGASLGNVAILILFKMQAKKNVRNDPNYVKANDIMNKMIEEKAVFVPRSPKAMDRKDYITKSIFIVMSTLSSFMVLSSIIVKFDVMTLISTLLSAVMALCFSWVTMLNNEEYWTNEYLLYAEMIQKQGEKDDKDRR